MVKLIHCFSNIYFGLKDLGPQQLPWEDSNLYTKYFPKCLGEVVYFDTCLFVAWRNTWCEFHQSCKSLLGSFMRCMILYDTVYTVLSQNVCSAGQHKRLNTKHAGLSHKFKSLRKYCAELLWLEWRIKLTHRLRNCFLRTARSVRSVQCHMTWIEGSLMSHTRLRWFSRPHKHCHFMLYSMKSNAEIDSMNFVTYLPR